MSIASCKRLEARYCIYYTETSIMDYSKHRGEVIWKLSTLSPTDCGAVSAIIQREIYSELLMIILTAPTSGVMNDTMLRLLRFVSDIIHPKPLISKPIYVSVMSYIISDQHDTMRRNGGCSVGSKGNV